MAFGGVTGYHEVPAGEYGVAINVAGRSRTLFSATIELAAEDHTAAAIGNLGSEGDEQGVQPVFAYEKAAPFGRGRGNGR